MEKLLFVSRDNRTFNLFRKSWVYAAEANNLEIQKIFRKEIFLPKVIWSLLSSKLSSKSRIIVFGVAEALLFCLLQPDLIVISGFGRLLMKDNIFRKFNFFLLKYTCKNNMVVVLNEDDRRVLKSIGFLNVKKINGEGVDFEKLKHSFSENLVFSKSHVRLLYSGRLLKSKGVERLLNWYSEFLVNTTVSKRKKYKLILMGDNDFQNIDSIDMKYLTEFLEKHPDQIDYVGFKTNIGQEIIISDYVVSCSKREGLPFSIVEGMYLGCGAILSNVPGHKEFSDIPGVQLFRDKYEFFKILDSLTSKQEKNIGNIKHLAKFSEQNVSYEIAQIYEKLGYDKRVKNG